MSLRRSGHGRKRLLQRSEAAKNAHLGGRGRYKGWVVPARTGAWEKGELSMPKVGERYVCEKCKQEILIVKAGHCVPQC